MRRASTPLTKGFNDLVRERAARDPDFASATFRLRAATAKAILRDYIKATVGFEKLAEATDTPPKSLIAQPAPAGDCPALPSTR